MRLNLRTLARRGLLIAGLGLLPGVARAACATQMLTAVPLDVVGNAILVTAEVNGRASRLVLDTGAQRSVLTEAAVNRLGLPRDQWVGTTMRGIGGIDRRPNADPQSLTLGGLPLVRQTLSRDTSFGVAVLGHPVVGGQVIDGVLGRDFLSAFDLDLDVPQRRLALYRVRGCTGRFLPWAFNYASVPVSMAALRAIVLPVAVDGVTLRAMLDTGAGSSLLALPGMVRLGLQPASLVRDPASTANGLGRRSVAMRLHRFRTMRVGDATTDDPVLWAGPVHLTPIVDMLLGADWLAHRRIWISFATRQLLVASP